MQRKKTVNGYLILVVIVLLVLIGVAIVSKSASGQFVGSKNRR